MSYKNVYQAHLLDHYERPRHKGIIEKPDFSSGIHNPSCGDLVSIQGTIAQGIITDCKFQAQGCVISCAAASLLLEKAHGASVQEVLLYTPRIMVDLVQIQLGPTRLRCALLALEALQQGLQSAAVKKD